MKVSYKEAIHRYLEENGFERLSLRAALFDMDGVLYNSMPLHAAAWVETMRRHGFTMTAEESYLHEGRTGAGTIEIVAAREGLTLSDDEKAAIYKEKAALFANPSLIDEYLNGEVKPMNGAQALLQRVTLSGLFAMLVTGSGQPSLLESLQNDFPGVFSREMMVTSYDVQRGKPDPEPYLMALKKGDLKPYEAFVVENAPLGIQSARAAKLFTIAVNTGPLPDAVLKAAGANLLFPSVEALAQQWDKIFFDLDKN